MSEDGMQSEDLLIRARRDELLEGEERRLRDVLGASGETRFLFEAGRAFDAEAPVLPGDDARIERMLRAVRKPGAVARVPARRVWLALAAGMLLGVTAVAVVGGSKALLRTLTEERRGAPTEDTTARSERSRGASPPGEAPASTSQAKAPGAESLPVPAVDMDHERGARAAIVPSVPARPRLAVTAASPLVGEAPAVPPAPVEQETSAAAEPRATTAAELFRTANQARMQGDSARAVSAYRSLETDFPKSAEALSARLSLGMLYLNAGRASLALEEFRTYRALARGPTLGEALWGESGALRQLSRREEERRVLGELLQGFPDSVYAAAARKRLAEP